MKKIEWVNGVKNVRDLTAVEVDRATSASIDPRKRDLDKREFEMLLASSGLEDVWGVLETYLKANDTATYAMIRGERNRTNFRLAQTLVFVEQMRPVLAQLLPDTDLSDDAVKAAWAAIVEA